MATTQVRFSAANRRGQILEVATRLFADQGFQGTTTRQIAEHSGVTEALIFRHFRGKEELYWAVIEQKIRAAGPAQRMRERLERSGSDMELLSSVAAEILERRAKDQTLSRLLLYSALENHRLSHRFFRIYVAECYEVLAEYVEKRIAEGRFRPIDSLLAARGFLGMVIYHSWVQELFGGKRYQDFSVQQVSETLAQLWLEGMQNKAQVRTDSSGREERHSDPRKHIRKNGNR
jgi:AcrR family transcriptional regulator